MGINNPLDSSGMRVFTSSATDGNEGGTTIVCPGLPTTSDFDGNIVIVISGDYKGEARTIKGDTTGRIITVDSAFSGQIAEGVKFSVFGIPSTAIGVSAIAADVGDASASTLGSLYEILGDPTETMTAALSHKVSCMEFWSIADAGVTLTSIAGDVNCPNIVVSGIPTGKTVIKALGILQFRKIENSNPGGSNGIQGAQNMQIKKAAGAWVTFLPLVDNQFDIAASTSEGGGIFTADDGSGCHAEVDGNATYNVKFASADVDLDFLTLHDVKVGLKVWFV
jgi:hypothetical protein